ncbi:MAG: hypothetical protein QXJ17_06465 [Nitrososphaeria archaeon]
MLSVSGKTAVDVEDVLEKRLNSLNVIKWKEEKTLQILQRTSLKEQMNL